MSIFFPKNTIFERGIIFTLSIQKCYLYLHKQIIFLFFFTVIILPSIIQYEKNYDINEKINVVLSNNIHLAVFI